MAILDYFQEPTAERVLLVEIERNVSPVKRYYLADGYYITEPTDSPANTIYSSIIGGSGLPQFRRTLNDPFTGNASTAFGSLELSDNIVSYIQDTNSGSETLIAPKGAKVTMLLAAPRDKFPRADALILAKGSVQAYSGSTDNRVVLEISDNRQLVAGALLEVTTFPYVYGQVRNYTPILTDVSNRVYTITVGAIQSVDAVYDDGVLLAPAQYTVNLTNATITLAANPAGTVTVDVKGLTSAGTWLSTTQQIITDILSRAGVTSFTTQYSLPSGIIGYVVKETTELQTILSDLCQGCGGYWLVDRLGILKFRTYPTVSGLGSVFTSRELLSEASYETEENLFSSIKFSYRQNWTVLQPRIGANAATAAFIQKESEESQVTATGLNTELVYMKSPVIKTYFDNLADAQTVATNILNIYSVERRYYSFTIPYLDTLDLGSTCTIMSNSIEATGVVTEVADIFDGSYPTQRIKMRV